MPVALSSSQFESNSKGTQIPNVWITLEVVVGQRLDTLCWNLLGEGNSIVYIWKCPHGYRSQQGEKD